MKKDKQLSPILSLGPEFYDEVEPAVFTKTTLRFKNSKVAMSFGLDLNDEQWIHHFAHFKPLNNNLDKPLALRYHGHQFRMYNPELGDGRGFLYAQLKGDDNKIFDLGTKGSGTTPYSRGGDGRLTLKGGVREVLATEFLYALGVNTSRTWSLIETHENLQRNDEPSPTRSAVMVRLSHGHIRIGSFQRLAYLNEVENLEKLLKYCLRHYYSYQCEVVGKGDVQHFLNKVSISLASTAAEWMVHGFVHGVLNTDNINITGESFDYGPYRFLEFYDPEKVAAYFDHSGLYNYSRQPEAVYWALQRLVECLAHFFSSRDEMEQVIANYHPILQKRIFEVFFEKLGLKMQSDFETNSNFLAVTYQLLEKKKYSYQSFFMDWYGGCLAMNAHAKYDSPEDFEWRDLLSQFSPKYENVPLERPIGLKYSMNYSEIEGIWAAIDKGNDWSLFDAKLEAFNELLLFKKNLCS